MLIQTQVERLLLAKQVEHYQQLDTSNVYTTRRHS